MAKRKRSTVVDSVDGTSVPLPPPIAIPPRESSIKKRASQQKKANVPIDLPAPPTNTLNGLILQSTSQQDDLESPLSDVPEPEPSKKRKAAATRKKAEPVDETATPKKSAKIQKGGVEGVTDPEADSDEVAGEQEIKQAFSRSPPVNSDYLPLPWKGRLGYVRLSSFNLPTSMLTISRRV